MAARASVDDRRLRPPRLETAVPRPSTAPHTGTPSAHRRQTPPQLQTTPEDKVIASPPSNPTRQAFVLPDPVAFRYLEEDPSTTVLERRRELQGYESYIVEQWATSRTHPTSVITTHTGSPAHTVIVAVLSVPTDEATWSPRLRVYFKALNQYHAHRRQTPLGILMVTNLSSFPSSLTVIPVPHGDVHKHRPDFVVNENLKRLACSGRVSLTLAPPSSATVAKFHQLYRTADQNDVGSSVVALVKLCQAALTLFAKLEIDYADGLLCDVTERALTDWWLETGSEHYTTEPHDGILGPTTVAALLGLLTGARNRLHALGAPVTKDPFDVDATKRAISHFQKSQHLARTRRLDRRTLALLHKATRKAAEHEAWTLPRVLKSTAAELSGKGGEMLVLDRRDRAGIAEVETCDLERFVQLVGGQRCKWLWLGKPMKKAAVLREREQRGAGVDEGAGGNRNLVFRQDEQGGFGWKARKSVIGGGEVGGRGERDSFDDLAAPGGAVGGGVEEGEGTDGEDEVRRRGSGNGLFKKASQEARSGLGKFKGKVGLRNLHHPHVTHHIHHHDRKDSPDNDGSSPITPSGGGGDDGARTAAAAERRPFFRRAQSSPLSSPSSPKSASRSLRADGAVAQRQQVRPLRVGTDPEAVGAGGEGVASRESLAAAAAAWRFGSGAFEVGAGGGKVGGEEGERSDGVSEAGGAGTDNTAGTATGTATGTEGSVAGSVENLGVGHGHGGGGVDLDAGLLLPREDEAVRALRRTLSLSWLLARRPVADAAYPRHLSFSLAEGSVLTWGRIGADEDEGGGGGGDEDAVRDDDDDDVGGNNGAAAAGGGREGAAGLKARLATQTLLTEQHKILRLDLLALATTTSTWTRAHLDTLREGLLRQADADQTSLDALHAPRLARVNFCQTRAEKVLRERRGEGEEGVRAVEVLAARIEYEVQGLRGRVGDVGVGVREFGAGVGRVEARVGELEVEGERRGGGWGCVVC
ncbi:hypothetical protein LTR08_006185 [Meristemomyces frigidus]|nr:hypothetical protein LTR08_006185 [Meristemomyces frigidus]